MNLLGTVPFFLLLVNRYEPSIIKNIPKSFEALNLTTFLIFFSDLTIGMLNYGSSQAVRELVHEKLEANPEKCMIFVNPGSGVFCGAARTRLEHYRVEERLVVVSSRGLTTYIHRAVPVCPLRLQHKCVNIDYLVSVLVSVKLVLGKLFIFICDKSAKTYNVGVC